MENQQEKVNIHVIDMPMGQGKTKGMIYYMNEHPEKRFLFVTPYLDEIARIKENCKKRNFQEPEREKIGDEELPKMASFKKLVDNGDNIATTHELFKRMNKQMIKHLKEKHYILVLDEVLDVVEQRGPEADFSTYDMDMSFEYGLFDTVKEEFNGKIFDKVVVKINDYKGLFKDIVREAEEGLLIKVQSKKTKKSPVDFSILWIFPPEMFSAFDEIYVLTYMFTGSRFFVYLKLFNLTFEYCYLESIDKDEHTEIIPGKYDDTEFKMKIRKLLTIYNGIQYSAEDEKNVIGKDSTALCVSWYRRHASKDDGLVEKIGKNVKNYFCSLNDNKHSLLPANDYMWTTWKNYQNKKYFPKLSKSSFVSCNCRATNKYKEKWGLAYPINIFEQTVIRNWLRRGTNGVSADYQDEYALSTMIQWIFRSKIRDGEPVYLYLPSKRMRKLLTNWLGLPEIK